MPRIVHLSSVHGPFDTRIYHKEAKTLANAGHDVIYLVHHEKCLSKEGVDIHGITHSKSRYSRWGDFLDFYRHAKKLEADVYHFHDPELLPVGAALNNRTDGKVVYDVHEDFTTVFRSREWIPELLQKFAAPAIPKLESMFASRCNTLIAATEWIERSLRERNHDTVTTIHNYPITESIEITDAPVERSGEYVLIYVGGLARARGLFVMLELVSAMPDELDVELWLLGPFGDEKLEREANKFVDTHDINDQVRFFGTVDYEMVFSYIDEADLGLALLDPVQYNLGIPTKIFEYMYARTPVVASDTRAIDQYLPQTCGRKVEYSETAKQVKVVSELLEDKTLRDEMGEYGREKVVSKYCWEQESEHFLTLYDNLMDNP